MYGFKVKFYRSGCGGKVYEEALNAEDEKEVECKLREKYKDFTGIASIHYGTPIEQEKPVQIVSMDNYNLRGKFFQYEVWVNSSNEYLKLIHEGQEVAFYGIIHTEEIEECPPFEVKHFKDYKHITVEEVQKINMAYHVEFYE